MAAPSLSYLALKVNALLDSQRFFDRWREKFRDPQAFGGSIKCRCPFHLGEGFRSFLLDMKRRTFRCTFTQCKAAAGGPFVELHALLSDKPLLEALLELRSIFKLDLPADIVASLADALAARAEELLREKKYDAAENHAALALRENPTHGGIQLLLAEICERRDRPADARPHYETAARDAIARKDWARAAKILERLRALDPSEPAYLEQAAVVAEARGDPAQALAAYLELGTRSDAPAEQRCQWLEAAHALDPMQPQALKQLGEVYREVGRTDEAIALWEALAERLRVTGEPDQALDVLESLARADAEASDERRADLMMSAGRIDEAIGVLHAVIEKALAEGATDRAERCLVRICEVRPHDVEMHWCQLTLLEETRRFEEASVLAESILAMTTPESHPEIYVHVLERLKQWRPQTLLYRDQLAAWYAEHGQTEAALAEMQSLAELCFNKGMRADAVQRVLAMRPLVADSPRRRLDLARLLVDRGCPEEACAECGAMAREALETDPALAEEACRAGLTVNDADPVFHEILLRLCFDSRPEMALAECRKLVEIHRLRGTPDAAAQLLDQIDATRADRVTTSLLFARLAAEVGQADRAVAEIKAVSQRDLSLDQTHETISTAQALLESLGDRLDLLQNLADLHRDLEDADAWIETLLRKAAAQRRAGSVDGAEATYFEILAVRKNEPRSLLGHAELIRTEQGFTAARPLYQRYIDTLLSTGLSDEAVRAYQQCVEWAPEDVGSRRALATMLAERGDLEAAREQWSATATIYLTLQENPAAAIECFESILARAPEDGDARKSLARLCAMAGDLERSLREYGDLAILQGTRGDADGEIETYQTALEAFPGNSLLTLRLAAAYHALGDGGQALSLLEELRRRQEESGQAGEMILTLRQMLESAPDRADLREQLAALLREMNERTAAAEEYRLLAEQATRIGDLEQAVAARRWLKEYRSGDLENREALADLYLRRNEIDRARREFDELAELLRPSRDFDRVLRVMEQRVALAPEDWGCRIALAEVREQAGQRDQAAREFHEIGDALARNGELETARQLLDRALRLRPDDIRIRWRYINLSLAEWPPARLVSELTRLAETCEEAGELNEAIAARMQIQEQDPDNLPNVLALGALYERTDRADEAVTTWREAYDFAVMRRQYERAVAIGQRILALDPTQEYVRDKNQEISRTMEQRHVASSAVAEYVAMADQALQEGDTAEAEKVLLDAAAAGPENATLAYERLAALYLDSGRFEEALGQLGPLVEKARRECDHIKLGEYLEKICGIVPIDHEHRIELVELSLEQRDIDKALEHFRKLLPTLERLGLMGEADNVGQMIITHAKGRRDVREVIAQAYLDNGMYEPAILTLIDLAASALQEHEPERALEYATQALSTGRENITTRELLLEANLALGRPEAAFEHAAILTDLYDEHDRPEKALVTARKMAELAPRDAAGRERLSEILEKQGLEDELCRVLLDLADIHEQEGNRPKAIEALGRYLIFRPDAVSVRKRYVEMAAAQGDEASLIEDYTALITAAIEREDAEEATRYFERALAIDGEDLELREHWVRFLYGQENLERADKALLDLVELLLARKKTKRAIDLIGSIVAEHPQWPILYMVLGDLHVANGAKGRAMECFRKAAALLEARDNLAAARTAAEKVLEIDPLDVATRASLIDWLLSEGQTRLALEHSRVLAGQYVDRNLLDLAEQEFRRIVSHEPEDLAVWQRVLEIIDRRGRKREHVSDFLLVAELMLRRGLLDEAQGLYRKAMQLDPENIEARQSYIELYRKRGQERDLISEYIDLADLLFARGRGAEGRALCQRVLELDASNSQAIHRINRAEAALSTDQVSISGTAADVTRVVRARAADVKVMREGVENYRQMLAAKPDNAMVRKRMADILFQLGEVEEALDEWEHASADFFDHGELEPAITLCEKILNLDPSRSGTRERLSRATVKKDSIAAIESAIESLQDDIFGQESRPPK